MVAAWLRFGRLTALLGVTMALARCASSDGAAAPAGPDASADASATSNDRRGALDRAVALAAKDAKLAPRLAAKEEGAGWSREAAGFVSPGWRASARDRSYAVGARFPERADGPLHVGIGESDAVGVTLTPVGARPSPGSVDGGRIVYRDVHPSTDLVAVAGDNEIEWLYVLEDAAAPHEVKLDVKLGTGIADLRLEGTGAYLAVDGNGEEMFRISRPYAIDSAGVRRDAGMEYRNGQLRIVLDPAGLAYPVLLDPAVDTAAWVLRSAAPAARANYSLAYDAFRQRVVLFGGGGYLGDTWEYDGTTWVLRSTVGPSPRNGAAMTFDQARGTTLLFGGFGPGGTSGETWGWDGSIWTQLCTSGCTGPSPRVAAAMDYDSARSRTVLFGGTAAVDGSSVYYGETWEWDGTTWSLRASTGPSGRSAPMLAFDASHGKTVLFGGGNPNPLGDTWLWDGTTWTQPAVTGAAARYSGGMDYLADTGKVVLYGGRNNSTWYGDTWEWNGTSWAQKTTATTPPTAAYHSLVYAASLHQLVTYANASTTGSGTWLYDGTNWAVPANLPSPRQNSPLVFDSNRSRTTMFGGAYARDTWEWDGFTWNRLCTTAPCSTTVPTGNTVSMAFDSVRNKSVLLDDGLPTTWEWSGTAWAQVATSTPPYRQMFGLAYDTVRQKTLMFGGVNSITSAYKNELWQWDGATWTRLCTTAPCSSTVPSPRAAPAVAFDSTRGVLVVFGGSPDGTNRLNDIWEWNGTTWSQKCTTAPCNTNVPSARWWSTASFDSLRGRTVIMGGSPWGNPGDGGLNDTWEWDGSTFIQTDPGSSSSPDARAHHFMAYDRARRRTVLFGGDGLNAWFGDTWEYHVRGNACASGAACATGTCVDGVCCESAVCGTCQDCSLASNPGVCTAVTNAEDADTCSGNNTCDAFGQCKLKNGKACTTGSQCASTYCADGYCCGTPCTGGCDVCNVTPGGCTVVAKGSTGSNPSCGGYLCTGFAGDCPTSCTADQNCASGYFCAAGGICQPRRAQASPCAQSDCYNGISCVECAAGSICMDGYCCGSACNLPCQTCSATPGTCTTVTNADDPGRCSGTSTCSATGACLSKNGQSCTAGTQCASGVCTATFCQPASCGSDTQCTANAYCRTTDGTCQPDQSNGGACTSGNQCTSGNCVDGVCCNTACSGLCQACSAGKTGGASGTCANIAAGNDPDNECATDAVGSCQKDGTCDGVGACRLYATGTSCGPTTCTGGTQVSSACSSAHACAASSASCGAYACNPGGTACNASCAADPDCTAGYYCATGGTCASKKGGGASCTGANQCTSGNCVDGVCCDTACNGLCAACTAALKGAGSDGTCGPIKATSDPQNECTDDGAASCQKNGLCNGAGACQLYASGTTCGATTCAGGTQTGYSCDGLGACKSGSTTACAPYTCGATACLSTCADDTQCVATSFCRVSDGTCQPDQAGGASCTSSSQCANGNCADGVCCDAPCNGLCQACSAAKKGSGADGVCGSVKVDTDPDNECAGTSASTCGQNGSCDGNGACKLWTPGTVCGATTCGNGTQTGYQCDGFGVCKSGNTTLCSPYACSGNVCGTTCADDTGCITADWCRTSDGSCQPDQANGAACSSSTQCASGNCVDGVCCDAPCNGLCQACSAAKKGAGSSGTCGSIAVDTDPDNECATDSVSTCKQTGTCDGAGACKKYPLGTTCGSTTCAGGTQTGFQCDGFGTCNAGAATSCAPYTCASTTACGTACASDTGCVATAYCDSATGACKGDQTNGATCTSASQCISGFCVDGVCCDQACGGLCQACTAALKGAGASGVCGSVKAGSDPQSECPDDGAGTCQRNGACNGAGACDLYAAGIACGASTCASGTQTGYACNGLGTCASASSAQCTPYVCQGQKCGTTCGGDADCVAADWCRLTDGTCQQDQANGATCASATQCASGNCVDGVCCDAPCGGACQACSASKKGSGTDGVCGSVKAGTDPDNECNDDGAASCKQDGFCSGAGACRLYGSGVACGATSCAGGQQTGFACDGAGTCNAGSSAACSPYVCNGGSCGVSCASDADCIASAYCDASSHCVPDQANGAACTTVSQCTSGFCTDGVCCDQLCGGTCQACSGAKKGDGSADGVCGAVKPGTDPDNDCAIDAPSTCQKDGQCDGAGSCRVYALGTACGPNTCSGAILTGQQCDGFGTCTSGKQTGCDPFVCVGSSCAISCADDSGCVATAYCGNSQCQPKVDNANACTSDHQCKSGFCVEGLCCNTACNGVCQACTAANKLAGVDGVCGDAKDGVDPHSDCTDDGQTTCARDGKCDGNGACRLYPAGTACGTTSCVGNVQTGFACNGTGACDPNATTDCGLLACASGQCKTACAADTDCASSAYCEVATSTCKPKDASGKACTNATTCETGYCVDGVCCDQACGGQCEACDVSTAKGKCSPVAGKPHGSRAACAGGTGAAGDAMCAARACDGTKSTASCVGYVGSEVGCRDQSCGNGVESFSATCNGAGVCGLSDEVQTRPCEPFACGATACKDKCAVDTDCAPSYKCDAASGKCISGATCDGDHTVTAPGQAPTDCRPYKCEAGGTCKSSCASVDDCMVGFVCADGLCSTATSAGAPADQGGGCGCRVGGRESGRGAWALLVLTGLALARRRRARASARPAR